MTGMSRWRLARRQVRRCPARRLGEVRQAEAHVAQDQAPSEDGVVFGSCAPNGAGRGKRSLSYTVALPSRAPVPRAPDSQSQRAELSLIQRCPWLVMVTQFYLGTFQKL